MFMLERRKLDLKRHTYVSLELRKCDSIAIYQSLALVAASYYDPVTTVLDSLWSGCGGRINQASISQSTKTSGKKEASRQKGDLHCALVKSMGNLEATAFS
jgi:hypothetical protein